VNFGRVELVRGGCRQRWMPNPARTHSRRRIMLGTCDHLYECAEALKPAAIRPGSLSNVMPVHSSEPGVERRFNPTPLVPRSLPRYRLWQYQ
jgi:hypothetical protein